MKKVLITGANGFIGQYLVEEFLKDYKVYCLLRPGTTNLKRLEPFKDKIQIIFHDIREPAEYLAEKLKNINIILHAAGNPSAEDSINDPLKVIYDNVIGTTNLLNLSRKLNLDRFVYYAAGETFGPVAPNVDSLETDPYNSVSPYAASKAAGEEICVSYFHTFRIPVSIIHITNTFGEKLQSNRFPVIAIKKILNNEILKIHIGNNGLISGRRWLHAQEVALQTRFILNHQKTQCEKWNSAGIRFLTNLEFASLISSSLDTTLNYEFVKNNKVGNEPIFSLSPSKLITQGWTESINIEDRIKSVVNWYRNNPNWLI